MMQSVNITKLDNFELMWKIDENEDENCTKN